MIERIKKTIILWQKEKENKSSSLRQRLILFLVSVTAFIIFAFAILVLLFGITGSNKTAVFNYISNELYHINTEITADFGQLSITGVSFAEALIKETELFLGKQNLTTENLSSNTELIEPLLAEQTKIMLNFMQHSSCSGVFTILDSTINPDINNSKYSRSGVFLKITQPNKITSVSTKFRFLRGPASIARENNIELLGQWRMEYNIENQDFFNKVITTAQDNSSLPLSRLYYWTDRIILKGNSEAGFLLCVPLISSNDDVFGVCGMEISDRMFKIEYSPNNDTYTNILSTLSPISDLTLHTEKGLIAGNYYLTGYQLDSPLTIYDEKTGFATYNNKENTLKFGGLHSPIKLYPSNSPYESENWILSVMMPMDSLLKIIQGTKIKLLIIISLLLLISLGISMFISKCYLKPVTDALNTIRNKNYSKSNYCEINDLMEFLSMQDNNDKNRDSLNTQDFTPMFEKFLENIKSLTPAEKNIFDMYLQGYNAQEIAQKLYLSINTIKTHNRKIFSKLNVSTRKELLVYIDMMKSLNMI